ncbi:rhodanese-like domain-containing protein [Phnomibacter sp. MR]|uniref:rhodanese-like domain-containing protein n=1 Tax=Phnomibacter sp. MR TaxID=3042318 RepID=UPI003A802DA5
MIKFLKKIFGAGERPDFAVLVSAGAIVVDVRTPEEYRMGHIKQSVNIPLQALSGKVAELAKKKKPIITVCRSGSRSGMAKNMLRRQGVEAYNGGPWTSFQHYRKQV